MPGIPFTKDNAREMARRSNAAQAARRDRERDRAAEILALPPADAQSSQSFPLLRLARVREHLNRLDGLLAAATDPKVLRDLADAAAKLQTQERELAGRPLPGSRRPPRDEPLRPPATRPRGLPPPPARPADPVQQQAPPIDDDADEPPLFTPSEL